MYRISNDTRTIESAEKILGGLEKSLETQNLSDLTVSLICSNAKIGRTTFYRLFDTPIDVLQYYSDGALAHGSRKVDPSCENSIRTIFLNSFGELMKHPLLMDAIVKENRFDIIFSSYTAYEQSLLARIRKLTNLADNEIDYLVYMTNAILSSALQVWHHHGKKEKGEDIYELIKKECMLVNQLF